MPMCMGPLPLFLQKIYFQLVTKLITERNLTYLANVPSLGHVVSFKMNTLMLGLLFCAAITLLVWKYKRATVDPMDLRRTKVDPLKVGELLSIL